MRTSSEKLKPEEKEKILKLLFGLIADTKTSAQAEEILRGLLSEAELITFAKRLATAKYLDEGLSYEQIRQRLKFSTATISQIQNQLENQTFKTALKKIKTDQWAQEWETKIRSLLRL